MPSIFIDTHGRYYPDQPIARVVEPGDVLDVDVPDDGRWREATDDEVSAHEAKVAAAAVVPETSTESVPSDPPATDPNAAVPTENKE